MGMIKNNDKIVFYDAVSFQNGFDSENKVYVAIKSMFTTISSKSTATHMGLKYTVLPDNFMKDFDTLPGYDHTILN